MILSGVFCIFGISLTYNRLPVCLSRGLEIDLKSSMQIAYNGP